jgi:hypothetical protein
MAKKYFLDGRAGYNHGCNDYAVYEDNGDGTATCIEAQSCSSCWQVGHDQNHVFAEVGEIESVEYLLKNCEEETEDAP